jgi:hypothetical protein
MMHVQPIIKIITVIAGYGLMDHKCNKYRKNILENCWEKQIRIENYNKIKRKYYLKKA